MNAIKTCNTGDGLAAINNPDTGLVIWQRALPSALQSWINDIEETQLPDLRILVKPHQLRHALEPLLFSRGLSAGEMLEQLLTDIHDLVVEFAKITNENAVDVRLESISHDACWKFHRDSVETRLLTTYRGPATEWVEHIYSEQAVEEQRGFEGPINSLGDGHVALFKGSSAKEKRGVVHRSPPIEGTGLVRLLLCLNQPSSTSPDPWVK